MLGKLSSAMMAPSGDHERFFPEAGNVGQDAAQVGNFHLVGRRDRKSYLTIFCKQERDRVIN